MKKICVTGAAGFIGSHLCEKLLMFGHKVVGIDNFSAGNPGNVAHCCDNPKFKILCIDTRYVEPIEELFRAEKFDIVFNEAASKKNVCLRDPREDCDVNARGTLNLLLAAKKYGVKKFIHASTGSVYGERQVSPQTEAHPLNPCSYYGVSKLAGERYVAMFDIDSVILRYFHVYGPRQEFNQDLGGVVAIWAHKLWRNEPIIIHGTGEQQRSFTYVDDVITANIMAMHSPPGNNSVYNCASGLKISLLELLQRMREKTGSSSKVIYKPVLEGDISVFDISNDKIKNDYNINFKSLEEGIDETLGYYKPVD